MNAFFGIFLHFLGGFASGSFYIPYRKLKGWSWESGWIVGGIASWILAPWIFGWLTVSDLTASIGAADSPTIFYTILFGVLWGFGGLTYGLTMRYLGVSLGVAVALGFCAAFGTLIPPVWEGRLGELMATASGQATLLGVLVCLFGIAVSGWAGILKERELDPSQQKAAVQEFDLRKGLMVGTFCGIMSACFAFGLTGFGDVGRSDSAGQPPPQRGGGKLVRQWPRVHGFEKQAVDVSSGVGVLLEMGDELRPVRVSGYTSVESLSQPPPPLGSLIG